MAVGNPVKRMIPGADQDASGSWIKDNGREYQPGYEMPATDAAAANVLRWGTGALNIDATRIEANGEKTGSNGAVGLSPDKGWNANSMSRQVFREQSTTQGRWPANLCHDGSQQVLDLFPQSKGAQGVVNGSEPSETGQNGIYGRYKRVASQPLRNDTGSAARFFYSAKASKADRAGSRHPTVKPVSLMQWLVRMVTPPGGTVLDPFAGSGTTGAAAQNEGFKVTLIEREEEYLADIKRRLNLE